MAKHPHCDKLFLRFFDRWCDDADRRRRGFDATRPDMLQDKSLTLKSLAAGSALTAETRKVVVHQIDTMVKAACGDWPRHLKVSGDPNLAWVDAFDRFYTAERIRDVIKASKPEDLSNDYVVLCCEFGAVLGQVMRKRMPRLVWHPEWPYWESAIFDPKTHHLIPVFHWAVKKMSGYGVDDGFAAKVEACLQMLDSDRIE